MLCALKIWMFDFLLPQLFTPDLLTSPHSWLRLIRGYNLLSNDTLYNMLLTKITAVQNVVALSHYKVRGIYFTADIFAGTIVKQNFYSLWSQSYTKNTFSICAFKMHLVYMITCTVISIYGIRTKCRRTKCRKPARTKCMITHTLTLILGHTLTVTGPFLPLSLSLSFSLSLSTHTLSLSL